MKKPVRLTNEQLEAVIAKRKHRVVTVEKKVPSGSLDDVITAAFDFAETNGVPVNEVKFTTAYYNSHMKIRRLETDAEKAKRVKSDQDYLYNDKKYRYDVWLREQERIQRVQANTPVRCCSKCGCGCC